jgi:hypothetical protein
MQKLVTLLVCALSGAALAQEGEAPPAEPASAPAKWSDRVSLEALVDTYYSYRFNGGNARSTSEGRVFDSMNGVITLNHAEIALAMAPDPAGFRIDIGFGPIAELTSEGAGLSPASAFLRNVQQAYASMKLGPVTVDAGKFVTNAGAEVIESRLNWLYSRSYLFGWAIPFAHTGVRATASLTDMISVQASVTNGWDTMITDDSAKTLGFSLFLNMPTGTTGALNVYAGPETAGSPDWRVLLDLVVGQSFGAFSLNLNADYAMEGATKWYGVALMARYAVGELVNLTVRGEHFSDPDGVRIGTLAGGASTSVNEVTVGAGFPIGKNAEIRTEVRYDMADQDIFHTNLATPRSTQATGQIALLGWF